MVGSVLNIPQFLTASTREELVRLMLSTNISTGLQNNFFDISFDGKLWTVWYYSRVNVELPLPKLKKGKK